MQGGGGGGKIIFTGAGDGESDLHAPERFSIPDKYTKTRKKVNGLVQQPGFTAKIQLGKQSR
jgi:hypothetical protein